VTLFDLSEGVLDLVESVPGCDGDLDLPAGDEGGDLRQDVGVGGGGAAVGFGASSSALAKAMIVSMRSRGMPGSAASCTYSSP
jgi:hypothetical protein